MPFCKRTILPKDVCKPDGIRLPEARARRQAEIFGDLADVCGFTLVSVLRQLSDLSRHSVSILEDLEGELVSICHRSGALEGRVARLHRHVAELIQKPPPRSKRKLKNLFQLKTNTPGVTLRSSLPQGAELKRGFTLRLDGNCSAKLVKQTQIVTFLERL